MATLILIGIGIYRLHKWAKYDGSVNHYDYLNDVKYTRYWL